MMELLVVSIILAVILLVVLPSYQNHRDHEKAVQAANQLREFASAFGNFAKTNGSWPDHKSPSPFPSGMEEDLPGFTQATPVGGYWDWRTEPCGRKLHIHLIEPSVSLAVLAQIDFILDNGDLASGAMTGSQDRLSLQLQR